jgi:hypothetical protein
VIGTGGGAGGGGIPAMGGLSLQDEIQKKLQSRMKSSSGITSSAPPPSSTSKNFFLFFILFSFLLIGIQVPVFLLPPLFSRLLLFSIALIIFVYVLMIA